MNVMDLIFGDLASLLSNAIIVVIVALMFVISLRLFLDRRKKGYMSMTILTLYLSAFNICFKIYVFLTALSIQA